MQITEKDIESVPQPIVSLFNGLEQTIMLDIIRRLQANNSEITRSADWQINRLYELGKSKEEIKSYIKNTLNLSDEQIDKVFSNVISSGYASDVFGISGGNFTYSSFVDIKQKKRYSKMHDGGWIWNRYFR